MKDSINITHVGPLGLHYNGELREVNRLYRSLITFQLHRDTAPIVIRLYKQNFKFLRPVFTTQLSAYEMISYTFRLPFSDMRRWLEVGWAPGMRSSGVYGIYKQVTSPLYSCRELPEFYAPFDSGKWTVFRNKQRHMCGSLKLCPKTSKYQMA